MLKISSKKWRRMLGIFTISSNFFVLQKKKKKKLFCLLRSTSKFSLKKIK